HARKRDTLLRRDHVHDPLPRVIRIEQRDTGRSCGLPRRLDEYLPAGHATAVPPSGCRLDDVIDRYEHRARIPDLASGVSKASQRDAAGAFVEKDAIDVQEVDVVSQRNDAVGAPDLVDEGTGVHETDQLYRATATLSTGNRSHGATNGHTDSCQRSRPARWAAEHQDDHAYRGEEAVDCSGGRSRCSRNRGRFLRSRETAATTC